MQNSFQKLQNLTMGDKSIFPFFFTQQDQINLKNINEITTLLITLNKEGFSLLNPFILLRMNDKDFKNFKLDILEYFKNNKKDIKIFRDFFNGETLKDYTDEEWEAILAQYAITYNWKNDYKFCLNKDADTVLNNYTKNDTNETKISELELLNISSDKSLKTFKIVNKLSFIKIIKDILESKIPLRNQQLETLKNTPKNILIHVVSVSNIIIKDTLIFVINLIKSEEFNIPLFKRGNDVLKYCVFTMSKDEVLNDRISKKMLKTLKLKIPTKDKKFILKNLDLIAYDKNKYYLAEDMFMYKEFWKRLIKNLKFTTHEKMKKRYKNLYKSIEILYSNNNKFTFNSRYSVAKSELDYAEAIRIATENPGFLLRNILEFLRMTEGTEIPKRLKKDACLKNTPIKVVKKNAISFFKEDFKIFLENNNINIKLLWQLYEQLSDKSITKSRKLRYVQGNEIHYFNEFPGIKKENIKLVEKIIVDYIKKVKREENKKYKKVYIDSSIDDLSVQYSGKKDKTLVFSGEFLSSGSKIDLEFNKDSKSKIVRLGVLWRGEKSCDIDHSALFITKDNKTTKSLFYGNPVLKEGNNIIATSSGDITTCKNSVFSAEFIDIDFSKMIKIKSDIETVYNYVNIYSGLRGFKNCECYMFVDLIEDRKKNTLFKNKQAVIDITKVTYLNDISTGVNESSCLGFKIDFKTMKIEILNIFLKNNKSYSNVLKNYNDISIALKDYKEHLKLKDILKKVFTKKQITNIIDEADLIISRKIPENENKNIINPNKNYEKLQNLMF